MPFRTESACTRWSRYIAFRALALGVLAGCSAPEAEPASGSAPAASDASPARTAEAPRPALPQITPDGIGAARVGMTLGEIRGGLEPPLRTGDRDDLFMVDLVAVPVVAGADTLYRLVFPAEEEVADSTVPYFVATLHDGVRTPEGVGPGTTLGEAAERYGSPRLRYSVHDEMREYASFPGYAHERVHFRVAPGQSTLLAGRYATRDAHNETGSYDEAARLLMVLVDLRH